MRYFTKEWYNDTLVAEMCFNLRKTEKAGAFSDKFFEKLYETEEKAYLKYAKRAARITRKAFDVTVAKAEFASTYEENLAFVKKNLPEEILSEIKDVRVLALGSVTYEMADRITRYCGRINNKCEQAKRQYDEATDVTVDRMGGSIPPLYAEIVGVPVASCSVSDGTVIITTSHEYTGVAVRITLTDAELTETDENIVGSIISEYELLPFSEDKMEFSILAVSEDSSLHTVTAVGKTVDIEEI